MNVIISNKYQELLANLDIDVIKVMNGEFEVEELSETFAHFFYNKMVLDITAIKDYQDINTIQKLSMSLDMSKIVLLLDDSPESLTPSYLSKLISIGIYNFTKDVNNIKYLIDNPNQYKDVAHYHNLDENQVIYNTETKGGPKIIGFKNITNHAGATTLIYMLKKQLRVNYNAVAIEVNRTDFQLFNDNELISSTSTDIAKTIMKNNDCDVILIDLNDEPGEDFCDSIINLIEPSTIMLNKMIRRNRNVFDKLKNQMIVLNKSLLDTKDVTDFEYESHSEIFFNIPPLDDKINRHRVLDQFLSKLGFIRQSGEEETSDDSNILNIFKKK